MKKLVTYLVMLTMMLSAVPAAAVQAAAADETPEIITKTETEETSGFAGIAGRWCYQESDESCEYVTIYDDGTYIRENTDASAVESGTVKIEYDEHPDGSATKMFSFYDSRDNYWIGVMPDEAEPDTMYVGQDGSAVLRRCEADPEETVPSVIAGNEQVSLADVLGKWDLVYYDPETESDAETPFAFVTIDEDGSFFYQTNNYEAMEVVQGKVELRNENGKPVFFFIGEDGKQFMAGTLVNDGNTLGLEEGKLVRDTTAELISGADIAGAWLKMDHPVDDHYTIQPEYFEAGRLKIEYDSETGTVFTYTCSECGEIVRGTVKVSYQLFADGSTTAWYLFYDETGEFWAGAQATTSDDRNEMYLGMDGISKLVRAESVPNDYGFYNLPDEGDPEVNADIVTGEWINPCVPAGNWAYMCATLYFTFYEQNTGLFTLTVSDNGEEDSVMQGSVKLQYKLGENGEKQYYYVLYYGREIVLILNADTDRQPEALTVYSEGDAGSAVTFTRSTAPYEVSEDLRFYDAARAVKGFSLAGCDGIWTNPNDQHTTLKLKHCTDLSGEIAVVTTDDEGKVESVAEGILKLQYSYDDFNERTYQFVMYVADEQGAYNQVLLTITPGGEYELLIENEEHYLLTEKNEPKYSDAELSEMALNDYEQKTGVRPAGTHTMTNLGGTVTIVLLDENGEDVDAYTVDPVTGIGEASSDESEVNLPQTGNNSLTVLLTAAGAFLMTVFGFAAVRFSGLFRRKKEQ